MELAWYLANIMNGFMVIPNLIALIALAGVIAAETKVFISIIKKDEIVGRLWST